MLTEQEALANKTREFLNRWGLKAKYVAGVCNISPKVLSLFINHRLVLSKVQVCRLENYISDYENRNS